MHREKHVTLLRGLDIVRHVRLEHQHPPGPQVVTVCWCGHAEASGQDVDGDQARSAMLGKPATPIVGLASGYGGVLPFRVAALRSCLQK